MSAAPAHLPVLKVTPMMVLADISPALTRYEALGFERVETGDAGCIGLRAGQTAVILASTSFVRGDFGAANASRLAGQTINYIHVASVDEVRRGLQPSAVVLQDARTRGGTRELLVDDSGDLFILAEKVA
jgi:hypothetical protein